MKIQLAFTLVLAIAAPGLVHSGQSGQSGSSSRPGNRAIQTPINMQVSLFDETESVLTLAPANQVAWARGFASGSGRSSNATQARNAARTAFPDDPPGMQAQAALISQIIMMGDVIDALRQHAAPGQRDRRRFTAQLMKQLDQAQSARSTIIRNFARTKPPRAYAGSNPQVAARAQDRSARYTQFVQMNTQLMNELQNTERELMDALQTMQRDLADLWQTYASMRDEHFRTNERVMQTR